MNVIRKDCCSEGLGEEGYTDLIVEDRLSAVRAEADMVVELVGPGDLFQGLEVHAARIQHNKTVG